MDAKRFLASALAAACALLPGSEGWAAGSRALGGPSVGAVPSVRIAAPLSLPGTPGVSMPAAPALPSAAVPAVPPLPAAAPSAPAARSAPNAPAAPDARQSAAHSTWNVRVQMAGPGRGAPGAAHGTSAHSPGNVPVEDAAAKAGAAFDGSAPSAAGPAAPEPPREPKDAPPSRRESFRRWTSLLSGWSAVRSVLGYPEIERAVDELLDRKAPAEKRVAAARTLARRARPETLEALAAAAAFDPEQAVRDEAKLAYAAVARVAGKRVPPSAAALAAEPPRPGGGGEDLRERVRKPLRYEALKRVVGVAAVFTAIELAGSLLTGSVSLQADAMHLSADLMINVGALAAIWASARPSLKSKPWTAKLEPLFGLVSAAAIAGMGLFTGAEAIGRLLHPAAVPALETMLLAGAGLTSNALSTLLLYRYRDDSVSLRGAFIHAATDALGSLGIIVGSALVLAFGWLRADPIISIGIVALILRTTMELGLRSWSELRGKGGPPSGGGPGLRFHGHHHH